MSFLAQPAKKCKDKFQEIRLRVTDEYDRPIVLNHDFIYTTYDSSKSNNIHHYYWLCTIRTCYY